MDLVLSMLMMLGRVLMETFTSSLFILIYLFLFIIITWQYKRLESLSENILERKKNLFLYSALASTLLGILGGLLGSVLLVIAGIDLKSIGILHLWIFALLLMLVNPRFLCFAYAGGLLSLLSFFFGYPDINIPQLLGLVAILHLIESMLILLNGQLNPVPVYVKKDNKIRGGFNLQKFWPIPLVALFGSGFADPGVGIMMPDWWPLLRDYGNFPVNQSYTLLPVLAVLGYGEITTTTAPARRVKKSALYLFIFSFILLLLSILSARWSGLMLAAAVFSPLGHEFVIWLGMRDEKNKKPLYVNPQWGVMVLDVKPRTPAARAGICSGDIILSINGEMINQNYALKEFLSCGWGKLNVEILRDKNKYNRIVYYKPFHDVGIITVPDRYTSKYLTLREDSIFDLARRTWQKIKKVSRGRFS